MQKQILLPYKLHYDLHSSLLAWCLRGTPFTHSAIASSSAHRLHVVRDSCCVYIIRYIYICIHIIRMMQTRRDKELFCSTNGAHTDKKLCSQNKYVDKETRIAKKK